MNDEKMIHGIHARDEQMLALAMQKYSRLLWKVAGAVLSNVGSSQDIEECVADVFIYLWQHPEKYIPVKAKLSSWLSLLARSRAIDRYRQIVRRKEISLEDILSEQALSEGIPWPGENRQLLRSCIDALDDMDQQILVRRYYFDQKPGEISLAMSLPKKQVENRLYSAKKKLRKLLTA